MADFFLHCWNRRWTQKGFTRAYAVERFETVCTEPKPNGKLWEQIPYLVLHERWQVHSATSRNSSSSWNHDHHKHHHSITLYFNSLWKEDLTFRGIQIFTIKSTKNLKFHQMKRESNPNWCPDHILCSYDCLWICTAIDGRWEKVVGRKKHRYGKIRTDDEQGFRQKTLTSDGATYGLLIHYGGTGLKPTFAAGFNEDLS